MELPSRTNSVALNIEGDVVKTAGAKFTRRGISFDPVLALERESGFLEKLSSIHFPRVLSYRRGELKMNFCGSQLTSATLPEDWREQVEKIGHELREFSIVHRDIRPSNLLVNGDTIVLIDFGWAFTWPGGFYLSPRELGIYWNPFSLYSNSFAFHQSIRQIVERGAQAI